MWEAANALFSKAESQDEDEQTATLAEGHLLMDEHNKVASIYSNTRADMAIENFSLKNLPTSATLVRVSVSESGGCFF